MFDAYGNHVDGGSEVQLNVDGFSFQDQIGATRKVSAIPQLLTFWPNVIILYDKYSVWYVFQLFFFLFWLISICKYQ